MKKIYLLYSTCIGLLLSSSAFSQAWVKMMHDPNANFYDIQKEFNTYWAQPGKKEILEKMRLPENKKIGEGESNELEAPGWVQFKRWEWMKEPRVYPSVNMIPPNDYFLDLEKKRASVSSLGNWTFIGITNTPTNAAGWSGVGSVSCVRFDPVNSSIIYAGAPSGGLWKSTNSGNTWSVLNTDGLGSLGISDIAIDPTNSQVIYIASGDRDGSSTNGLGVLKSTNGGATWNSTGLNWLISQVRTASKILIDPTNTQIIHVATNNGIYRSVNGGTVFTQVSTMPSTRDMEFKPGDPTTIYVTGLTDVYRSTNSGLNYSSVYSVPGAGGLALAVTPANAGYVYILATDANTYAFKGVYRSINSGTSFNLRASTPNILGSDCTGSDNSGQGWYDLCIAVSPSDAENVFVGGVSIWKSPDGGSTWSINSDGYGCTTNFVSWDIHDLSFQNGNTLYAGCDAGVFRTQDNGQSWAQLDDGLAISQCYSLGQSATNGSMLITSLQDVGTDLLNGTTWSQTESGEATKVFIDRTNNSIMYGGGYNGHFSISTTGGIGTWTDIITGLTGSGAWVTPWKQDLGAPATLWAGYQEIFKSINQGANWAQVSSLGGSESFSAIDQSPSNNQVIYASRPSSIIKTTTGGTAWTAITGNLPVSSAGITNIEVDPTDENHVWVTFSGYSAANKVWVTTNGGTSWTNYSTGLPNIPANTIVYENNSAHGTLYVGTDAGVYCRNSTMSSWMPFNSGLPNVIIDELEIQYTIGKIRAATYGRGMWESDLAGLSLGVSYSNQDSQVNIYPNPSKGIFTIKAENLKIKNIELFNMLGERIYTSALTPLSNWREVDLSTQPNGVYFIHVICDEGRVVKKITINK